MNRRLKIFSVLMCLSACASDDSIVVPAAVVSEPEERIAQSFERLEDKVSQLAVIQKARRKVRIDDVSFAPTELKRRIHHYEYTGHLSRIVQDVAEQSGYKFRIIGRAPNIPIILSVKWNDISLIEALRDAGVKAAHRATVFVDAEKATIEVRYDS